MELAPWLHLFLRICISSHTLTQNLRWKSVGGLHVLGLCDFIFFIYIYICFLIEDISEINSLEPSEASGNNLFDYVALLKWRVASWTQPYVCTRLQLRGQSKFLKSN